jgi:hypothetical protein
MLRASIETAGGEVDLSGLADGSTAAGSPVRGAAALVAFVEAVLSSGAQQVAKARERVREELGSAAVVDAAAVIGNFERMVRIADGTGIPLDTPINVATESIQVELGIDQFDSASRTASVKGWQRALGRVIEPVLTFGLRRSRRRATKTKTRGEAESRT